MQNIRKAKGSFWAAKREKQALSLFRRAARSVPAYKDFLRRNKIDPSKIKTFKDLGSVPPTSKKEYLKKYSFKDLLWEGSVKKPLVFTSTSGSTGEPFYFPRQQMLDEQYSYLADFFLKNSSYGNTPTLVVICFGMGIWIGGLITYKAFEIAAQRGDQPISIITPGINKPEIFNVLRRLAPQYSQVVLAGYPPFLKDIVDQMSAERIDPKKLHLRFLSAAEAFTENFRDHLAAKAGIKNVCMDTLNIYGTADIGAMAWETPAGILMRRLSLANEALFRDFFPTTKKIPTLANYNPAFITFEAVNNEILLTGDNAIPLVRYAVGDQGGVFSWSDALRMLKNNGVDFPKEARMAGIMPALTQLPFVYVYERSDFSVVLSGANIYPEEIREAIQHKKFEKFLTTKFVMETKNNSSYNEYLEINVELKPAFKKPPAEMKKLLTTFVVESLLQKNSEYSAIYHGKIAGVVPEIVFRRYEDPEYFKAGIKQKWVKK